MLHSRNFRATDKMFSDDGAAVVIAKSVILEWDWRLVSIMAIIVVVVGMIGFSFFVYVL